MKQMQSREGEALFDREDTKTVSRSAGIKMPRGKEMLNPLKVFVGLITQRRV